LQLLDEKTLFRETFLAVTLNKLFPMWSVNCERKRNAAATLENFRESLVDTNIEYSVCLPIAPNNTYEDMRKAHDADNRIIAFASPDFTWRSLNNENAKKAMKENFISDLRDGAMGVKIHPILQEIEADADEVMQTVEVISAYNKPVLLHSGKATYHIPAEGKKQFAHCASIDKIERLISTFPNVLFIVGHAGLNEIVSTIELLPKYKNVYVDTSFQPPEAIRVLISAFGSDRVLFASDWPYGLRKPAILAVKEACGDDISLQKAVLYDNAKELLKL
jgi:predicted TIM-barrel fold metal-dependent hydrolase